MSEINLIIQREYLTRVKKKSFIIMSIVGPLLFAALMIVPVWLASEDEDNQNVEVIDETTMFINQLKNTEEVNFNYTGRSLKEAQKDLNNGGEYTSVLYIPSVVVTHPNTAQIFYKQKPKGSSISFMEREIAKTIENNKLQDLYNLTYDQVSGLRPNISLVTKKVDETGNTKEKSDGLATGLGMIFAFIIYFFIFLFGVQVMRGVIEEKTNRIVEVIISSVKPFQLMMGKIVGIALVAFTQIALWIVLSFGIYSAVMATFSDDLKSAQKAKVEQLESMSPETKKIIEQSDSDSFAQKLEHSISTINFPVVIGGFLFFFIGGYLLYGSLFAAVGAAVDNETDTQQFMMPITIPLILGIIIGQVVVDNPDGALAFWGSIIPFTSPIVMMIRIPFGVDYWEVGLSAALLILAFIGSTWMAGKIYRTGILMYGKKVNFKELGKWLTRKS